ncbi:MAG: hypothetical protein ABIH46_03465 [Chloroflexota bacterium]
MRKLVRFGFKEDADPKVIEDDLALAIFSAECVYGKPRVRMEAAYAVAKDGKTCVLDVSGESGEAAARIFAGLAAARVGENAFTVRQLPERNLAANKVLIGSK